MSLRSFSRRLAGVRARFGTAAMWTEMFHVLVTRFVYFQHFHIVVLDRADLKPFESPMQDHLMSRRATRKELQALHEVPQWEINDTLLAHLNDGDECILSLVDGQVAGYAWAHLRGRPELTPGLSITVPRDYIYNYAGFTHPAFRGAGLQSYRHHSLLDVERWKDRKGLLGYVRADNFPSRRGQAKSGYRRVGSIWLVRIHGRYLTAFSPGLRRLGIRRLRATSHVDSGDTGAHHAA
jgi:GNAT superfamily N-acetyltransferase